ncbi:hypothetical protein ACRXB1_33400, partial [Caballeronia sp. M23-90]
ELADRRDRSFCRCMPKGLWRTLADASRVLFRAYRRLEPACHAQVVQRWTFSAALLAFALRLSFE